MDRFKKISRSDWGLLLVLIVGFAARMFAATCGDNFDVDSYKIVAEIADRGGNVYAGTDRYNYGPVWFETLRILYWLAGHDATVFRHLVAALLSLVDVGIFFVLRRYFGNLAACLFFLNPISIIITGYHSQFDNLAILLGMLAVILAGDEFEKPVNRRKIFGLLVLGLSLMTKHLLFAFPFWLAVKQKGLLQKFWILVIPALIFGLGFVPYWHEGRQGIIQNVFLYRSSDDEYFYNMFVPQALHFVFNPLRMWLLLLAVFAFIFRAKGAMDSLLLYTCVLVVASPATANQYLAIPVPFVSTCVNAFTILYVVFGTWHLFVNPIGIKLGGFADVAIYMLSFALAWAAWKQNIIKLLEKFVFEIKNQLGLNKSQ
jgi:hypothetical protein